MGKVTRLNPSRKRPVPPAALLSLPEATFAPAPEVLEWLIREIVMEDGVIHNPDHAHLLDVSLQVLWANGGFRRQGRTVIGTAEEVTFRCGAWQKGRQEQQMREWFGTVPDYLITLDASYAAECSDADWCALVEHEMYHLCHKKDPFGAPAFTKDGDPKIGIQGHDVEEFIGVVKRYGVGDPGGAIAQLAAAARGVPSVSMSSLAGACGTCLLRAA